jgi:putative transposase
MLNSKQLTLSLPTWGGRRKGAGRKGAGRRPGVPHVARPEHAHRHPLHVTLRAGRGLASLRKQALFKELRRSIKQASRLWFRIVHFSVQSNHVHLVVEATDRESLSRGAAGLSIRLARAANRAIGRRGSVWRDRYHARPLRTPREVRSCLVYVLANWRQHAHGARGLDPCASGAWFDGWRTPLPSDARSRELDDATPVVSARTWLGSSGWRRHGLIDMREHPKPSSLRPSTPLANGCACLRRTIFSGCRRGLASRRTTSHL